MGIEVSGEEDLLFRFEGVRRGFSATRGFFEAQALVVGKGEGMPVPSRCLSLCPDLSGFRVVPVERVLEGIGEVLLVVFFLRGVPKVLVFFTDCSLRDLQMVHLLVSFLKAFSSLDEVTVVSGKGSPLGEGEEERFLEVVKESSGPEVLLRLSHWGIDLDALVETAMVFYIPDPKFGDIRERLFRELERAFLDPNIQALLLGALYLEEAASRGEISALRGRYGDDPVELLADELIGLEIAQYLGGSRALFEFYRIDRSKPGLIGRLPPFLDDAIGGLLAGVLVKVCS